VGQVTAGNKVNKKYSGKKSDRPFSSPGRKMKSRLHAKNICVECGGELERKDGELACRKCGLVVKDPIISRMSALDGAHLGHPPVNQAVFRHNSSTTSKNSPDVKGPEPHVLAALNNIQGQSGFLPSKVFAKECPHEILVKGKRKPITCGKLAAIPMYGQTVRCEKCGGTVGEYIFRWLPGCENPAIRVWADLRVLNAIDGIDDHPLLKRAREIFNEVADGQLSEEDAHRYAGPFIRMVKETFVKKSDDELVGLLHAFFESEKVRIIPRELKAAP